MAEHVVAKEGEIEDGGRLVTQLEGQEVGVFRLDGEYHAYTSWCAHQSGPICEGSLAGTMSATFDTETNETTREWIKDDEILRCPWHYWEYDIVSGECLSKNGIRLPSHDVRVEDGEIIVSM